MIAQMLYTFVTGNCTLTKNKSFSKEKKNVQIV